MQQYKYTAQGYLVYNESFIDVSNVMSESLDALNASTVMSETPIDVVITPPPDINCSTYKYSSACGNQTGCKWNAIDTVCRPDCLHIPFNACKMYPACAIKTTQTCVFNA